MSPISMRKGDGEVAEKGTGRGRERDSIMSACLGLFVTLAKSHLLNYFSYSISLLSLSLDLRCYLYLSLSL